MRVPCRGADAGINADDMTMYYDEKLKRWVDPAAPETSEDAVVGPPPIGVQSQALAKDEPARPEPDGSSGTADLMAPPPSFRKKRGARGTPAKTSTAALPGGPTVLAPGALSGGETNFSSNNTEEVSAPVPAVVGATGEARGDMGSQGAADGMSRVR